MKTITLLFVLSISVIISSCKKEQLADNQYKGLLKRQGPTTYQYGTHTLTTSSTTYALTSKVVDLDKYLDRVVIITGKRVNGYPVDGGPEYIDVKEIK
jgi:UDP-galactopyranose mutase